MRLRAAVLRTDPHATGDGVAITSPAVRQLPSRRREAMADETDTDRSEEDVRSDCDGLTGAATDFWPWRARRKGHFKA